MAAAAAGVRREVDRVADPAFGPGNIPGHRARRLIDGQREEGADPFLMLVEDVMPRDAFSRHPHRGIETVTIVLDGALEHYDSAGHGGVIAAGDAQWMTAGRGVVHNENALPGPPARLLQLWVNLPAAAKMAEPRYQDLRGSELPVHRGPGVEIRLLSGRSGPVVSPTLNHVPVTALDVRLAAGAAFEQALDPGFNGFVLVLDGGALVGDDERPVPAGALAWLTRSDDPSRVRVGAGDVAARVLLIAGLPIGEPVVFGGPFVMNTPEQIRQAYADYREGRF